MTRIGTGGMREDEGGSEPGRKRGVNALPAG